MKLRIIYYDAEKDFHVCKDEQGKMHRVDIMVSGFTNLEPQDIIGREITVGELFPYIELAKDVEFFSKNPRPTHED